MIQRSSVTPLGNRCENGHYHDTERAPRKLSRLGEHRETPKDNWNTLPEKRRRATARENEVPKKQKSKQKRAIMTRCGQRADEEEKAKGEVKKKEQKKE